jgi:hypothetical protein
MTTPTRTSTLQTQTDVGHRRKVARFLNTISAAITIKPSKKIEKPGPKESERITYPPTSTSTVQTQTDVGHRRKVARFLNTISAAITTKPSKKIEISGFKESERTTYPTTPGENLRNPKLAEDISIYNNSPTPIDGRLRAGDFISNCSRASVNGKVSSRMARNRSPTQHQSTPVHILPAHLVSCQGHSNSLPEGWSSGFSMSQFSRSPGSALSEWRRELIPISGETPEQSGTPLVSNVGVSPSTTAAAVLGGRPSPAINVSGHEGS